MQRLETAIPVTVFRTRWPMAGHEMKIHRLGQLFSAKMIVTGVALIIVNALGLVIETRVVNKDFTYESGSIPGYNYPVQDKLVLQNMLSEPMRYFDPEIVNSVIFELIVHGERSIRFSKNWLMSLGGRIYAHLSSTQNVERIVSGGAAICNQVSAVFNDIARLNGFETRIVGLSEHVVSEIQTDSGWKVVDPDFGVTYPVGIEALETAQGIPLVTELLKDRGYDKEKIDGYVRVFQSSDDNVITEINTAMSPRLYAIKVVSEWLKWPIPAALILIGFFVSRRIRI